MNSTRNIAVEAFGITTAVLLSLVAPLASPGRRELFHLDGTVHAVLLPVLLDFALVWLLLTCLLLATRRYHRAFLWTQLVLAVVMAWKLLLAAFTLNAKPFPAHLRTFFFSVVAAGLVFLVARASRRPMLLVRATHAGTTLAAFVAISGVVMLAEMSLFCFEARHLNDPVNFHHVSLRAQAEHPQRILWIVFDELSYRQLYEHRYPGLTLPAFDRLAAEATVFTDARPAASGTEIAIPSYLTGRHIFQIDPGQSLRTVLLEDSPSRQWHMLDAHDTVFEDAIDAGYQTGLAGWFNPYCRLIPSVLDHCFWVNGNAAPGNMYARDTLSRNAEAPFFQLLHVERSRTSSKAGRVSEETFSHQQDYFSLFRAADALLRDRGTSFVLLHMPIPHPDGIYNRHTRSFAVNRPSYLDNLALCDAYLAHVRSLLERQGTWGSTTLVITGDHSWRVNTMWAATAAWTAEEQRASEGGQFDDRPGYIVRLPGQHAASRVNTPFDTVRTRDLFRALLHGTIRTPADLVSWAR